MPGRGSGKRRGYAIAAIALTLLMVAPELTPSVGATGLPGIPAATGRDTTSTQLVAKRKRRYTTAQVARYLRTHPKVLRQRLRAMAARSAAGKGTRSAAAKTPAQRKAAARARARQRAVAARRLKQKRARKAVGTRPAARKIKAKPVAKTGSSSVSLPKLGLLAIAPFLLIGIYLLFSDSLRRRVPKKRHASLVITRVSDR